MCFRFNSLQTGRSFRTEDRMLFTRPPNPISFNSLQTGRSFRTHDEITDNSIIRRVSIPFKREGLSEQGFKIMLKQLFAIAFQFPSNGKVFPNSVYEKILDKSGLLSFNSLQTGRSFRTAPSANPVTVRAKLAKTKRELRGGFFR